MLVLGTVAALQEGLRHFPESTTGRDQSNKVNHIQKPVGIFINLPDQFFFLTFIEKSTVFQIRTAGADDAC